MQTVDTRAEWNRPLEEDFDISLSYPGIPIEKSPSRLTAMLVWICLSGSADVEVDSTRHQIKPYELRILFPRQIVALTAQSDDFTILYFSFSQALIPDVLFRFPPHFVGYLKDNFHLHLPPLIFEEIRTDYFCLIARKFWDVNNSCRREITVNLLRNFFLDLYDKNQQRVAVGQHRKSRKSEQVEVFINLVMNHFRESREVSFYASKLNITPKYLSMLLKEVNGKTAKEWIDNYVITELKLLLKSTNLSIQEIAYEVNFPNQSFLCKYFKARTGLSPKHYRTH